MSQASGDAGSDDLVARAIRELIHSVPGTEESSPPPETPTTSQPWAETASPSAKNKRPLDAILTEYAARVEAAPEARARLPADPHPSVSFYDRFGRPSASGDARRRRRRRVARRGRGSGGRRRSG